MKDDDKLRAIEAGNSMEILLCDPAIQRWFEDEVSSLKSEMIGADLEDDAKRRNCVLGIRAIYKLRSDMQLAVARARRLSTKDEAA